MPYPYQSIVILACLGPAACVMANPSWDPPIADAGTGADDSLETGGLDSNADAFDSTSADTGEGDPTHGQDTGQDTGQDSDSSGDGDGDGDPSGGGHDGGGHDGGGDGDGEWGGDGDGNGWGDGSCGAPSPSFGPCPPSCDECYDGICWRTCSAGECHDDFIVCPVSWSCRLRCIGKDSCKDATLACAGWGSCDVECIGEDACASANIVCAAGPCEVTCGGDAAQKPCDHLDVKCGGNETKLRCEEPFVGAGPFLSQNKYNKCGCTTDCKSAH